MRPFDGGPLMIAGTEGLLVTYARCCFPIPNDPIMAYLSAGRGVMIHRQNCGNLAEYRKQPEKWLSVAWEATEGRLFSSRDPAGNQQPGRACWRRWPPASRERKPISIRCLWKNAT